MVLRIESFVEVLISLQYGDTKLRVSARTVQLFGFHWRSMGSQLRTLMSSDRRDVVVEKSGEGVRLVNIRRALFEFATQNC